jgi:hypothetical protein
MCWGYSASKGMAPKTARNCSIQVVCCGWLVRAFFARPPNAFRLAVSPLSLPRALRLLDALLVALESSGGPGGIYGSETRKGGCFDRGNRHCNDGIELPNAWNAVGQDEGFEVRQSIGRGSKRGAAICVSDVTLRAQEADEDH